MDGFRALLSLADEHHKAGLHCSVIAGPAVFPLLRIVNDDHGLSIVGSVPEALQLVDDAVRAEIRRTG